MKYAPCRIQQVLSHYGSKKKHQAGSFFDNLPNVALIFDTRAENESNVIDDV
jgi:hypothetical protein